MEMLLVQSKVDDTKQSNRSPIGPTNKILKAALEVVMCCRVSQHKVSTTVSPRTYKLSGMLGCLSIHPGPSLKSSLIGTKKINRVSLQKLLFNTSDVL